jgi:plastocyanin
VRSICIVAALALAATLTACGADPDDSLRAAASSTTATPQPPSDVTFAPNGETAKVVAIDNNFLPQTIEVAAGTEVEFVNNGRNPHNVVPADDATASTWGVLEAQFQPKDTYSRVFDRPGTYTYYCTIHGTPTAAMFGTITVTEP